MQATEGLQLLTSRVKVGPLPALPWSSIGLSVLGLCTAIWMGPQRFETFGLVLLYLLLAGVALSRFAHRAPNAWWIALGGLLFTTEIAIYPSVDVATSLSRLYGVALGIATVAVLAGWFNSVNRVRQVPLLLLIPIAAWSCLGLIATNWFVGDGKGLGLALDPIYMALPRIPASVPYLGESGIHPNKLAAPLAMFAPLPIAIFLFVPERWPRLAAAVTGFLALGTLALTQSRSSYIAAIGAVLLVLTIRWRAFGILLALFVGALIWVGFWAAGPESITSYLPAPPLSGRVETETGERTAQFTLADRVSVWKIAWAMIGDFPFTGIGIGMFPIVARTLYPSFVFYGWDGVEEIPHSHNLFLQVAVDVGVPGFACFTFLTVCLAVAARRAFVRSGSRRVRALVVGAGCGLLAYYLYGLTDAIGLGEKPGMIYWGLAAVVAACARLPAHRLNRVAIGRTGRRRAQPAVSATPAVSRTPAVSETPLVAVALPSRRRRRERVAR